MDVSEIKINENFKNLIPKLDDDTFKTLENSIVQNGILDPLIVWNGFLVDGHHRYKIAKKYNIPFKVSELDDPNINSEKDVMMWMIQHQISRRNLTVIEKGILANKQWGMLSEGKEEDELPDKQRYFQELFHISVITANRVQTILESGDEKLIQSVYDGSRSVYDAWLKLAKYKKVQKRVEQLNSTRKSSSFINDNCFTYMSGMENRGKINCVITEPLTPNDELIQKKYNDPNIRRGYCVSLFNKTCSMLNDFISERADLFFIMDPEYIDIYIPIIKDHFSIRQYLVWDYHNKLKDANDRTKIPNRFKFIIMAYKGNITNINSRCNATNIIKCWKDSKRKGLPISLCEQLLSYIETDKTVVFDPFAGYGAVLIASLRKNLESIGCEIDPEIYEEGSKYISEEFTLQS